MAATDSAPQGGSAAPEPEGAEEQEQIKPVVTRRDFLVGVGAGAAVGAVVVGGISAATRPSAPAAPAPAAAPQAAAPPAPATAAQSASIPVSTLPATMRRVTLNINGTPRDVTVDVRESLWETLTYKLGMGTASALGCDRAECGACAVVVDGRAVNSCAVMSGRLGRGQKIVTVEGLAKGTRLEDLHPVQRAYHQQSGLQCGICTRGFVMSTYALLARNTNPNPDEVAEALSGNICRCGSYPEIYAAVEQAAAEMRRA